MRNTKFDLIVLSYIDFSTDYDVHLFAFEDY